jgi:hypothetical protein
MADDDFDWGTLREPAPPTEAAPAPTVAPREPIPPSQYGAGHGAPSSVRTDPWKSDDPWLELREPPTSDAPPTFSQRTSLGKLPINQAAQNIENVPAWKRYPWLASKAAANTIPMSTDIAAGLNAIAPEWTGLRAPGETIGERFKTARGTHEAYNAASLRDYPGTTIGGTVAGLGLLPLGGPANKLAQSSLKMAPWLGNTGAQAVGLGTVGGVYGGLSGYGSGGDSGGDISSRLRSAGIGTGIGTLAGAATPAISRYIVEPATSAASDYAGRLGLGKYLGMPDRAEEMFRTGIESSQKYPGYGMTPKQFAEGYFGGENVLPIDLGSQTMARDIKTAITASPEAEAQLKSVLNMRKATQQQGLWDFASNLLGHDLSDDYASTLKAKISSINNPAYEGVSKITASRGGVYTPELEKYLNDSSVSKQIPKAIAHVNDQYLRGELPGYQPGQIPLSPFAVKNKSTGAWEVVTNPVSGQKEPPPFEFWNQLKKEVGSSAEGMKPTPLGGGDKEGYRMASGAEAALRNELIKAVPEYGPVVKGAKDLLGEEEALQFGPKFLSQTRMLDINDSIAKIQKMTPAQLEYAQHTYLAQRMKAYMDMASNRDIGIQAGSTSPTMKGKDVSILGQQNADALEAKLLRDAMMNRPLKNLGGSDTMLKKSGIEKMAAEHGTGAVKGAVSGMGLYYFHNSGEEFSWPGLIKAGILGGLTGGALSRMTSVGQRTALEFANKITSNDPATMQQAIRYAVNHPGALTALRQAHAAATMFAVKGPKMFQDYQEVNKRAAGGRISDQLVREAGRACKALGGETKPLMDMHDSDIVNALRLAKGS